MTEEQTRRRRGQGGGAEPVGRVQTPEARGARPLHVDVRPTGERGQQPRVYRHWVRGKRPKEHREGRCLQVCDSKEVVAPLPCAAASR